MIPNPNFAVNLPAATVGTGAKVVRLGISLGSIDNIVNFERAALSAAETSGHAADHLEPANPHPRQPGGFASVQGTLIPFSQISAQGVQTTFQEAKLQLLVVKPHVTADGSDRDAREASTATSPTSTRPRPAAIRRSSSARRRPTSWSPTGTTVVIGGIYTRNTGRNIDQVPFFGDIPILGILFQRRRASDTRNELVIFLTPRIVNRAEALGR